MSKRDLTPQTPGEPPSDRQMPPQEGETTEITPQMQALIDAEVARRVKASRRADMEAKRARPVNTDLPTQRDALENANQVGRAVLSRDGWVVPSTPAAARPVV